MPRKRPPKSDLQRASELAKGNPFYFAELLETYRQAENLDEGQLAQALGCVPTDLPLLALCRRPASDPAGFRADVTTIARRFALNPAQLAQITRAAMSYQAMTTPQAAAPGQLLVARDRAQPEPPAQPPTEDQSQ